MKCSSHCHPSKTCHNVDLTSSANISLQDRMIVNDGKELTFKHMLAAQQLVKQRFILNHGFRDTLTLVNRCEPEETPYIKILYFSNNHRITIAKRSALSLQVTTKHI